jgi:hypothetical protein
MTHSAMQGLKALGVFDKPPSQAVLDAAEAEKTAKATAYLDAAGEFAMNDIRSAAVAAVKAWAGTQAEDLEEGESMADRLMAFAVGIADENKDGEITGDEADVINIGLNAMADYMVSKGVTEADAVALLNDGDNEAAERVAELISGGDEGDDDVDSFVFDSESSESVMDSILAEIATDDPVLDAVYKKKLVIRKGKKVRINKRVSGTVRLNAKQKVAIRKAGLKSRSSVARMHRMKSMKIRRKTIG